MDKLKVALDPHEAATMSLPDGIVARIAKIAELAGYLEHDHVLPTVTRRGLVKRAEEHAKNTGQVGTVIFN